VEVDGASGLVLGHPPDLEPSPLGDSEQPGGVTVDELNGGAHSRVARAFQKTAAT